MTEPKKAPGTPQDGNRPIGSESDEDRYRAEAAAYIAELTGSLATMARKHDLAALGFILEMAQLEAENANRYVRGRR